MERKSDEEICLFVRDEQTGRFLFNAKALRALVSTLWRLSNVATR
jgi:hypothetical protein